MKFKILPSCLSEEILLFLVGWIGNQHSDFAETFHSLSLSKQETAVSGFCSVNLSYRQYQSMKYEILMVKFLRASEKVEISNFIGWFCLKDKFLEKKNGHISFLSWKWRDVESFSKIWIAVSDSAHPKMVKFLGAGEKTKILNFIVWFFVKNKLLGQKIERIFFWAELEIRSQFCPKLSMDLSMS